MCKKRRCDLIQYSSEAGIVIFLAQRYSLKCNLIEVVRSKDVLVEEIEELHLANAISSILILRRVLKEAVFAQSIIPQHTARSWSLWNAKMAFSQKWYGDSTLWNEGGKLLLTRLSGTLSTSFSSCVMATKRVTYWDASKSCCTCRCSYWLTSFAIWRACKSRLFWKIFAAWI